MATTEPKQKPSRNKKFMLVRHTKMNLLDFFEHNQTEIPKTQQRVVIKTDRGLELGYLVGQLTTYRGGQFRLSNKQVREYFNNSEIDFSAQSGGRFVRFANAEDISEERHLEKISKEEQQTCEKFAADLNLDMKVIDTEHIFGGERIIFYFRADGRVDFRELVKRLAHEYQTRIEMRQIGSRDEAKILGDFETCGQQCCCQRFLQMLKPVNMRMAKMQKATLDPSKISGYCGRLKCCLRYEDQTYLELKKKLPKRNTEVQTPHGRGKVIEAQILTQLVVVEHEDNTRTAYNIDEIKILGKPKQEKKKQNQKSKPSQNNANENGDHDDGSEDENGNNADDNDAEDNNSNDDEQ